MTTPEQYALGLGCAAIISLPGWIAARRWPAAAAIGVGLGFVVADALISGPPGKITIPSLPPIEAFDWIFWIALLAAIMGAALAWLRPAWWFSAAVTTSLAALAAVLLAYPLFNSDWKDDPAVGAGIIAMWAAGVAAATLAAGYLARDYRLIGSLVFLALLGVSTSTVLAASGSIILAIVAAGATCTMAPAVIALLSKRDQRESVAIGAGVFVMTLSLQLSSGYFWSSVPVVDALLLLAPLPIAALVESFALRGRKAKWALAIRVALLVAPLAAVTAWEGYHAYRDANDSSQYE